MKFFWVIFFLLLAFTFRCSNSKKETAFISLPGQPTIENNLINPSGQTLETRISVPPGYKRVIVAPDSFAQFLRNLPLKPPNSLVLLYNGKPKSESAVACAVVNLPIGNKDLHQCADGYNSSAC